MMLGIFVSGKTRRHSRSAVIGWRCHVVSWRHSVLLHSAIISNTVVSCSESLQSSDQHSRVCTTWTKLMESRYVKSLQCLLSSAFSWTMSTAVCSGRCVLLVCVIAFNWYAAQYDKTNLSACHVLHYNITAFLTYRLVDLHTRCLKKYQYCRSVIKLFIDFVQLGSSLKWSLSLKRPIKCRMWS